VTRRHDINSTTDSCKGTGATVIQAIYRRLGFLSVLVGVVVVIVSLGYLCIGNRLARSQFSRSNSMLNDQNKPQDTLNKQARLILLGGLFAAGLATSAPVLAETLNVNLFGSGSGKITSNPPGIDCGLDCTESYALNTTVELTATATSGSVFHGWYIGSTFIGGSSLTVLMDASKTVNAVFIQAQPPEIADLTVSPSELSLVGQRGQTVTAQIQVSGGTEPYQVAADGGGIFQINSTTFEYRYEVPTAAAIGSTIEDVIRVADATVGEQRIIEIPVTITVQVPEIADLTVSPSELSLVGQRGQAVTAQIQVSGGIEPYQVAADRGGAIFQTS
jgi:hypothetical protein